MEFCIENCEYYNTYLGICDCPLGGRCPMDEMEMDRHFPDDPLEKNATDITPYDVYSINELF